MSISGAFMLPVWLPKERVKSMDNKVPGTLRFQQDQLYLEK